MEKSIPRPKTSGGGMDGPNFATPTLSSLNKLKPIAVIRAYDDVHDHRGLLDRSKLLTRLRTSPSISPLLHERKLELEQLISSKSLIIVRQDMSNIISEGRDFMLLLSNRHGDASYQLDVASSTNIDTNTKIRCMTHFVTAGHDERIRLLVDSEAKFKKWLEVIFACREVTSVIMNNDCLSQLDGLISKSAQVVDVQIEGCLTWIDKILRKNMLTLCHYLNAVEVGDVTNMINIRRSFVKISNKYKRIQSTNGGIDETISFLIRSLASIRSVKVVDVLVDILSKDEDDVDDSQDDMMLTSSDYVFTNHNEEDVSFLSQVMSVNQRMILKVFYASLEHSARPVNGSSMCVIPTNSFEVNGFHHHNLFAKLTQNHLKRIRTKRCRTKWKKLECSNDLMTVDGIFWQAFWSMMEELLTQRLVTSNSCHSRKLLDRLEQLISSDEMSSCQVASSSLKGIFVRIHWTISQEKWSSGHRKMISLMEGHDDHRSIGSSALEAINAMIEFSGKSPTSFGQVSHCLTLTLNTFFNWIECEESRLSKETLLSLILADMKVMETTMDGLESMKKFVADVKTFRENKTHKILSNFREEAIQVVKKGIPDYSLLSSRTLEDEKEPWIESLLKATLDPVTEIIGRMTSLSDSQQKQVKSRYLDELLTSIISVIIDDSRVKFTSSGAILLSKHVSYLEDALTSRSYQLEDHQLIADIKKFSNHLSICLPLRRSPSSPAIVVQQVSRTSRVGPVEAECSSNLRHRRLYLNCLFCLMPI